jgi:hypothetical protein
MPHPFPNLKLTLTANPGTIYVDKFHHVQPLIITFSLVVENQSRSDFNGQAMNDDPLHVTVLQDGQKVAYGPDITGTMVKNIKIASGQKSPPFSVLVNFDDVQKLKLGIIEAEGEFTPTGDKTKISIPVQPSLVTAS